MTLIAQINGTAAFVASVNGSTPFNITAATSSEFVASMAAIGPQGPSGVATATFPIIYTSETQNVSIEPNYFALVSALDDYLLITDAAITYQTIAGMNVYLTAATAASTYYPLTNPSGFITSAALTPYLLSATAATTYYLQTNPSGFITAAALTGYATEAFVTSQGYITSAALTPYLTSADAATTYYLQTNPSNFITSAALSGYATETWVGEQGFLTAPYNPFDQTLNTADTVQFAEVRTDTVRPKSLNANLNLTVYNDTGLGIYYTNYFDAFTNKLVFDTDAGGITFPDGTSQTTAWTGDLGDYLPLAGGTMTGAITYGDVGGVTTTLSSSGLNVVNSAEGSGATVGYDTLLGVGYVILNKPADGTSIELTATGITFPDGTVQTTAADGGDFLPLAGGTMTGAILFGTAGQNIDVGSFDNGTGGSNGISLNCAVNYELNWQGGFLENRYSGTAYPIGLNSNLIFGTIGSGIYTEISSNGSVWATVDNSAYGEYTKQRFYIGTSGALNPVWIDASLNMGTSGNPSIQIQPDGASGDAMKIDGFGLTFPDATVQTTAWTGTYNPFDQSLNTTDTPTFVSVNLVSGGDSGSLTATSIDLGSLSINAAGTGINLGAGSGLSITFPDATIQDTAFNLTKLASWFGASQSGSIATFNPPLSGQFLYYDGTYLNWGDVPNPFDQSLNIGDAPSFGSITITDPSTNITLNGAIQFSDTSTQTTAFPPSGGTTLQYIDGTGGLQTFPTGGAATRLETTVYNNSGTTIPQHRLVYINGRHGNDPTIALAQANSEVTSRGTFGFTTAAISNMSLGTVIQVGLLEDVHYTESMTDGDLLFLSPTVAGGWTNTQPSSPNHYVNVGTAIRVHPTQGSIQVRVVNSNELSELSDVQITSAVSGDLIVKNGSGYWVSQSKATAGIAPIGSPTFTGTVTIPAGASIDGYLTTTSASTTYAPLASPTFTGNPQAPTKAEGDNTTSIATTQFVTTAVAGGGGGGGANVIDIQTFGSAGQTSELVTTWTKPAGAKLVVVHIFGAGGGGAGGSCQATGTARSGGGGGAGGAYSFYNILPSDLGATCDVRVAVGGAGGAGRSTSGTQLAGGAANQSGNATEFGNTSPATKYWRSNLSNATTAGSATGAVGTGGSILGMQVAAINTNGASGQSTTGSTPAAISTGILSAGSGGGGAGAAAASVVNAAGGAGQSRSASTFNGISTALAGGAGGTTAGVQATAGADTDVIFGRGMGGGGGFYMTGVAGGTGGRGGFPSGGGGGGGASDLGFLSGAGGQGGNGKIIVITYF